MRLQANDYGFDSQLPTNEFESTIENSEKMFAILSDHIYKDKILAVIRELCCNAYDAMVDAGKKDCPFKLRLPTTMDPTFYVEDDGVGIEPSMLPKIYLTYGRSTKTNSDETIGALGLGSKSPFAYTKSSFIVRNRWNGIEYSYFVYINQSGKPAMSEVGQEPTDRGNGLRAEFAVKPQDIPAFFDRTDRFFKYWKNVLPIFVDQPNVNRILKSKISKVIEGNGWYLERRDEYADFKGALAIMGNIPYPIEADSIPNLPDTLKVIAQNSFVIEFPLGALAFQPSREALSFDEFTNKNLIERLDEVRKALAQTFQDQVFVKGQTQLQFRQNFHVKVHEFARVIRQETTDRGNGVNQVDWVVKMLLDKTVKETVSYDGYEYGINDLLNNVASIKVDGHQPFSIVSENIRKNGRLLMSQSTMLKFVAKEKMNYGDIFKNNGTLTRQIDQGDNFTFDWTSSAVVQRKDEDDYSAIHRMILSKKFDVTSFNHLKIDMANAIFVINDEGGPGEHKFKAYLTSSHRAPANYFYVKHNTKETNIVELTTKIAEFIDQNGLRGAVIEFTSNLEDYRPAIERVKKDRGTKKLTRQVFSYYQSKVGSKLELPMGREINIGVASFPTSSTKHAPHIFSWDELKNAPKPWLYLRKNRSKTDAFEHPTLKHAFITHDRDYVRLALSQGLLDDVMHEVIPDDSRKVNGVPENYSKYTVLVLTDGEINELKKKGVKMVSLYGHVNAKVEAMFKAHDYMKDIEHDVTMENLDPIKEIYRKMQRKMREELLTTVVNPNLPSSDSLFMSLLKDYDQYVQNKNLHLKSYVMLSLYQGFVQRYARPNSDKADKLINKLHDTYPILRLISYHNVQKVSDLKLLLNYIAEVDDKNVI